MCVPFVSAWVAQLYCWVVGSTGPWHSVALLFEVSITVTVPDSAGFAFAGPTVAVKVTDWLTVEVGEEDTSEIDVPAWPTAKEIESVVLL